MVRSSSTIKLNIGLIHIGSCPLHLIHNSFKIGIDSTTNWSIEEFLNNTKIRLPHLMKLTVNYDQLIIVTENFTRDVTRLNCTKNNYFRNVKRRKRNELLWIDFFYITLIEQQLKLYIDTLYDDAEVIWQDVSDSKHRSQYALNKINEIFNERVEPEEQAAKMTDIWSIENIWGYIK
ncbi:unnamed protein product [Rotaria sp. Silwood2]|nr:unnamed protein product [Rotaria sp. Silwood2]